MSPTPFQIHVPDAELEDLKDRLRRTRCPDEVEGAGHRIVASAISARAVVPGADPESLAAAAAAADEGCPFSALVKASATVTVEARLADGD